MPLAFIAVDPIRVAIRSALIATPAVTSLLGTPTNIFHRVAPRNAAPPYVVFHRQAETDNWTFDGPPLERDLWLVKAISRGASDAAEDIAAAINTALNDAALNVDDYVLLNIRRESKVDYGERDDETTWSHCGAIYRIDVQPL